MSLFDAELFFGPRVPYFVGSPCFPHLVTNLERSWVQQPHPTLDPSKDARTTAPAKGGPPEAPSCSMDRRRWSSLLLGSFFHDPHSGLAEILTCFFPLILWGAAGTTSLRVDQPLAVLCRLLFVSLTCIYFPTGGRMDTRQPTP